MAEKKNLITAAGRKKVEEELQYRKLVEKEKISRMIKEAREQGDLSENAEYDAAKEEQGKNEARIRELEDILKNSEVVSEEDIDYETVTVGCQVTVQDVEGGFEEVFCIVGAAESNSLQGKVANDSPVGKALMNAKVGDIVDVEAPKLTYQYKVLDICKAPEDSALGEA